MAYASVDPVIDAWSEAHALNLNTNFGGHERRFVYTWNSPVECFQISIEPPEGAQITINAWSIETWDDVELHQKWLVPIARLEFALQAAWREVETWKLRSE